MLDTITLLDNLIGEWFRFVPLRSLYVFAFEAIQVPGKKKKRKRTKKTLDRNKQTYQQTNLMHVTGYASNSTSSPSSRINLKPLSVYLHMLNAEGALHNVRLIMTT